MISAYTSKTLRNNLHTKNIRRLLLRLSPILRSLNPQTPHPHPLVQNYTEKLGHLYSLVTLPDTTHDY